jgi:hypothetical protein
VAKILTQKKPMSNSSRNMNIQLSKWRPLNFLLTLTLRGKITISSMNSAGNRKKVSNTGTR